MNNRPVFAVAFGPPWKAPYGGGVDSKLPWAHLVFPERVIFEEFGVEPRH